METNILLAAGAVHVERCGEVPNDVSESVRPNDQTLISARPSRANETNLNLYFVCVRLLITIEFSR